MERWEVGGGQQTEVGSPASISFCASSLDYCPSGYCQDCLMCWGRAGCHVGCQVEKKRSVFPNSLSLVVLELQSNSLGNKSLRYCWG